VCYEYPQGRRVNVLAAYEPLGPAPWLDALPFERALTGDDLLAYLRQRLPASEGAARGGAGQRQHAHQQGVQGAPRGAGGRGVYLYYLPPCSPELNRIEAVFKQVKHHEIPKRSHASKAELRQSAEQGFASYASRLRPKGDKQSRPAA
jgi:transposase